MATTKSTNITTTSAQYILKYILGEQASPSSSSAVQRYLALGTTPAQPDGTGFTELSGNGYARCKIGSWYYTANDENVDYFSFDNTSTDSDGNITEFYATNTKEIHFNMATGSWGTTEYFAIYDSASGGNIIYAGTLTTAISPTANTVPLIQVGYCKISIPTPYSS